MLPHEARLGSILLGSEWFVSVLEAVRESDPPDWLVGAGAIRNQVWDHLHGHATPTPVRDVDVAFFDLADVSRDRDERYEAELGARLPGLAWNVTNQAGVHLWYERKFGHAVDPASSIEDAVARWPETATAVGVRLLADGRLRVVAPFGLDDLFDLVLRRNPRQVSAEYFRERVESKRIRERWPRVTVVDG
jgi:hypothetical protein